MKKIIAGLIFVTSILAGCGSLALKEPEITETLTSSQQTQAIVAEEEAEKNALKFVKTIQEFEEIVRSQIKNSDIEWTDEGFSLDSKIILVEYKAENSVLTERMNRIYIIIDKRLEEIDKFQEELNQVLKLVMKGLGEEYLEGEIIKALINPAIEILDYSQNLGIDIARSNKGNRMIQLILYPL